MTCQGPGQEAEAGLQEALQDQHHPWLVLGKMPVVYRFFACQGLWGGIPCTCTQPQGCRGMMAYLPAWSFS